MSSLCCRRKKIKSRRRKRKKLMETANSWNWQKKWLPSPCRRKVSLIFIEVTRKEERVQKLTFSPCLCQPAQQWWHKTQLCYPGTHLKPSDLPVTSRWVPVLKNGISQHSQVSCPWILGTPGLWCCYMWVESRFFMKSNLLKQPALFLTVV